MGAGAEARQCGPACAPVQAGHCELQRLRRQVSEGQRARLFRQGTVNCSVCVASAAPLVTATATTSFSLHSSAAPASCAAAPCSQAGEMRLRA